VRGLKHHDSWQSEGGFTLAEVMIVIVLMGIVLSIASASWLGIMESRKVDSAVNQLASDLRLAQTQATNQLTDWRVMIYPGRGNPDQGMDYKLTRPSDGSTLERNLPENSMIISTELNDSGGSKIIRFRSDGAAEAVGGFADADGDGEIRLTVSVDGNPERSVTVVPATSRIKVAL
jgi:prepilin-type N-terminal cleavage/methylation domain-containing protein